MIWWHEYKEYKKQALRLIYAGTSDNMDIQMEIEILEHKKQSKNKTIENIINILSNGQHYAPLHDFSKFKEQTLF